MRKNCIVVPIYKQFNLLAENELLSLNQLYKILGTHTIYLIGPDTLNFKIYADHAQTNGIAINTKTFDAFYLSSIKGYNKLLISEFFYKEFSNYKFILIYQTDALVFRSELDYWSKKDFDYIGAPWSGIHVYDNQLLDGVGNGGFSLRKIKSALKMLKKLRLLEVLEQYRNLNSKGIIPRLPSIILKLHRASKSPCNFEKDFNWQEDVFWCISAPKRLNSFTSNSYLLKLMGRALTRHNFKIAPVETALQFSFETNPQELFKQNKERLPFGCHAWERYEPAFWKAFIPGEIGSK